jgi:diacylglycerol kinase (ATP)
MKHLFIINPVAGRGRALKLLPSIKEIMDDIGEEYHIEITENPGHATDIARSYTQRDNYRVYSVGGDGTLNEVMNGMVNSKSSLAVIPGGTGNDFIRSITSKSAVKSLLKQTICGSEKLIDIARVNGRYFINIASLGFDAEVVYSAKGFKKIPWISGQLAYLLGILKTLFINWFQKVTLEIDGRAFEKRILLAAVANGRFYGGGMMPAPDAQIDDGLFDVCVVRALSRIKILFLFPKYIKGKHGKLKEVSFYKAKRVRVSSNDYVPVNIDGEVLRLKEMEFEIVPKAMSVVIPSKDNSIY